MKVFNIPFGELKSLFGAKQAVGDKHDWQASNLLGMDIGGLMGSEVALQAFLSDEFVLVGLLRSLPTTTRAWGADTSHFHGINQIWRVKTQSIV